MELLEKKETECVSGAMNLNGFRESTNIIDLRGKDMGSWIDAANTCWKPGTSSNIMYPGEFFIPNIRF